MLRAKQRMLSEAGNEYRLALDSLGETLSPLPAMLKDECREHIHLMQLIGDPLLRLKRPEKLNLKVASELERAVPEFSQGETIEVLGTSTQGGILQIEVAYKRGRLRYRPAIRNDYDSSHESFSRIHEDYLRAQDPVCKQEFARIPAGNFSIKLKIPQGCRGDCDIRATLLGAKSLAVDSTPIRVRSNRQTRKLKPYSTERTASNPNRQ